MKYILKKKIDGVILTCDEKAKEDFKLMMNWNEDDFNNMFNLAGDGLK